MSLQTRQFYEFADFRLDVSEKVLRRGDEIVPLTPKVFDTLKILIENAGHLLEKEELMRKIWQDRFVEEGNLAFNIKVLRKALNDNAAKPKFIETVQRRGYRFIAEVKTSFGANVVTKTPQQTADSVRNSSSKPSKLLIPVAAFAVLLITAIVIGSWYARNRNNAPSAPVLSAAFNSERLSTNGKVFQTVISPDGKNVVYTNGIKGKQSVWLRQLETGSNVEIIPPSDDVYGGFALAPDGDSLYITRRPRKTDTQLDIYRVSIFGGIPVKIISETQGGISISPDGSRLSFVRCYYRDDEYCSLWIADSADGRNEQKIATRPRPIRISGNRFSPDGKSVAFAVGQSENQANEFSLMEVNLENGTERELTAEKFFNIKSLSWLPNQSGLLITASRIPNQNFRIWQVSAFSGEVEPLTKDSDSYSALSLDKNGNRLVSTQVKEDFHIYLLNVENPTHPRNLADGDLVAFAPNGKIVFSSEMSGNDEIWSVNPDGSEQRQLTNNPADDHKPIVSPDGNSIFFASNRTGESHVWRMNADGSNQTQITQKTGGFPLFVSPDGEWLYYHHGIDRTLWRISNKRGEENLVLDKRKMFWSFSPDGSSVAFSEKQGNDRILATASTVDGQITKTFALPDRNLRLLNIAWMPDGKSIVYVLANTDYESNTLWRQSLDGKPPQKISDLGDEEVSQIAVSPDGKSFAIAQGGWRHDAVLLKGLK